MIDASLIVLAVIWSQFAERIEIPDWETSVRFELVASQEPVRPGDSLELGLVADIKPGYHLYGPEEREPSRTKVVVVTEELESAAPIYPPVIRRDLEGLGAYDLYEGRIAIRVPVKVTSEREAGELEAAVEVSYQVCTDFACSAPTTDVISVSLPRAKAGASVKKLHPDIFKAK
ncbi:MAG TPA: protein-disulfide reductase DsbD N-terminal domain-containing protein [Vicinamibacteria bacterium]|nr:protein-disulfide reductase DsbD N-terminal domain-containing protein [Vicinamibacteria bacterium]